MPTTMPARPNNVSQQMNNRNLDREGLNRSRNARQHGVMREGRRGR
ncbi:hypothetical protein [Shewanella psychropiezotolerans]|nr:hypothetical protein [Shewanella psychropiezotolerans]